MRHCSSRTENLSSISAGIIADYDTSAKRPVVCAHNAARQGQNLKHVFCWVHTMLHHSTSSLVGPDYFPSVCELLQNIYGIFPFSAQLGSVFAANVPPPCMTGISRVKVAAAMFASARCIESYDFDASEFFFFFLVNARQQVLRLK